MKKIFILFILWVPSLWASDTPNIVLIMADDLGFNDISFFSRTIQKEKPFVDTPNIDALAETSLWFTDGHSATALCAPTRYAMMSGKNNYRSYSPTGVWSTFAPSAFEEGEPTLGTLTRDAGYTTGFIGKWHLGGDFNIPGSNETFRGAKNGDLTGQVDLTHWVSGGPKYCGFDYDFTSPCGVQGPLYLFFENQNWYPIQDDSELIFINEETIKNPKDVSDKGPGMGDSNWDAREIGKTLSAKAVEFIKTSANKEAPFFLYYCSPTVHLPHRPTDTFDGRKIKGTTPSNHLDMTADLDMQVKRIVDSLKETGEFDNTLIIFTSDNGGLQDRKAFKAVGYNASGGWNGTKNSPLEGGHRVPFFATWSGHITPGTTDELATSQDMLATLASVVGTELEQTQGLDSNNLLPLFTGKGTFQSRDYLVQQAGSKNQVILRKKAWKLIIQSNNKRTEFDPYALYNLGKDPHEDHNQIDNPELKDLAQSMFEEYIDIIESGRATAPGRQ